MWWVLALLVAIPAALTLVLAPRIAANAVMLAVVLGVMALFILGLIAMTPSLLQSLKRR